MKLIIFLLLILNFCNNLDERVQSCYKVNQCNIAALNCMATYAVITAKTNYPIEACIALQASCLQYCRSCEKTRFSSTNTGTTCFTNRGKFFSDFKFENFKNPVDAKKKE